VGLARIQQVRHLLRATFPSAIALALTFASGSSSASRVGGLSPRTATDEAVLEPTLIGVEYAEEDHWSVSAAMPLVSHSREANEAGLIVDPMVETYVATFSADDGSWRVALQPALKLIGAAPNVELSVPLQAGWDAGPVRLQTAIAHVLTSSSDHWSYVIELAGAVEDSLNLSLGAAHITNADLAPDHLEYGASVATRLGDSLTVYNKTMNTTRRDATGRLEQLVVFGIALQP